MKLSDTAERLARRKYYQKDADGNIIEDFDKLCLRVAMAIAGAEKNTVDRNYWAGRYYQLMNELWFLPGGRILANAGSDKNNSLYNCYYLSIEDSRDSIYTVLKKAAEIFAHGGGIGFNFSHIREKGSAVSNGSKASGPVSFLGLFDYSASVISQASRRGAQLACLDIDHPDIFDFIRAKDTEGLLEHFNLSIGITDDFMTALGANQPWKLISRYDGRATKEVDAKEVLHTIAEHAWNTGDPGILYLDSINRDNAVPQLGRIEGTNPCVTGETLVAVADGRMSVPIKQLAEEGKDVLVYSLNRTTGEAEIKLMWHPRISGRDKKIIRIRLANNMYIRCTENHKLVLGDNSTKEARDLVVGDQLHGSILPGAYIRDDPPEVQPVIEKVCERCGKVFSVEWFHREYCYCSSSCAAALNQDYQELNNYRHLESLYIIDLEEAGYEDVYTGTVADNHNYYTYLSNSYETYDEPIWVCNLQCGEQPLRNEEVCDLGSINLVKMLDTANNSIPYFSHEKLAYATTIAIRFLDSVHDVSEAVLPSIGESSALTRKIGLGVMGWADVLAILGLAYDSKEALDLARQISLTMKVVAYETSRLLADERGPYPAFDKDKSANVWFPELGRAEPTRNASLICLAPTGSISILAGVNSSIEPFFSLQYDKLVTEGNGSEVAYKISTLNPYLKILVETGQVQEQDSYSYETLPEGIRDRFKTAHDLSYLAHLNMQAAWQENIEGSISKSINLPHDATVEDVENIIILGWKMGLKGLTVYRDGCKQFQILNKR